MENDRVLITGASSGIGFEIAKVFAAHKYDLVITARNEKNLSVLKSQIENDFGVKVNFVSADLNQRDSVDSIIKYIEDHNFNITILINNAGFAVYGRFTDTSLQSELEMLNVNMISLVKLTKHFSIKMLANGEGKILNVASTAAFQPGPLMALYYASKSFVLSFSEALNYELKNSGVTVSTLCPGPTKTNFEVKAKLENSNLFKGKLVMNAEAVAIAGFRGLMKGKPIIVPGFSNRMIPILNRFAPRSLILKVVENLQKIK